MQQCLSTAGHQQSKWAKAQEAMCQGLATTMFTAGDRPGRKFLGLLPQYKCRINAQGMGTCGLHPAATDARSAGPEFVVLPLGKGKGRNLYTTATLSGHTPAHGTRNIGAIACPNPPLPSAVLQTATCSPWGRGKEPEGNGTAHAPLAHGQSSRSTQQTPSGSRERAVPMGPQRAGVDVPLSYSRACLHTAFIALSVPFVFEVTWVVPSQCAALSPPSIGPKAARWYSGSAHLSSEAISCHGSPLPGCGRVATLPPK